MKIAVSAEMNEGQNSTVAHHFGRCPYFALAEVADKGIDSIKFIENPFFESHQPGQVPEFIKDQGADVMLSGGMGRRAIQFFKDYDIETATGASGTVKDALIDYLDGKLSAASSCAESEAHSHGHHHLGPGHNHD